MTTPGLWDAPPHLADTQEAEDFRERMVSKMTEDELVRVAEEKGWTDGAQLAAYSPPVAWRVCDDVDDAYRSAYWHAVAYVQPWARDFPH